MKYDELQKSIKCLEEICRLSGHSKEFGDADISVLHYQNGANGPSKEKIRVTLKYDDCHIAMEYLPQEGNLNE